MDPPLAASRPSLTRNGGRGDSARTGPNVGLDTAAKVGQTGGRQGIGMTDDVTGIIETAAAFTRDRVTPEAAG